MNKLITVISIATIMLFSINMFSQTKWIFHKSHSGANHSLFADMNNTFGPGEGIIPNPILLAPLSHIRLKYKTFLNNNYPIVRLDSSTKTMRFIDVFDSLIGCDKKYTEYLTPGTIVYDEITTHYYAYQSYRRTKQGAVLTESFIPVTDSLALWTDPIDIRGAKSYIFSSKKERIPVNYPRLWHISDIGPEILPPSEVIEKLTKKEQKKIDRLEKKLTRKSKKQYKKEVKIDSLTNEIITLKKNKKNNGIWITRQHKPPTKPNNRIPVFLLCLISILTLILWIKQQIKIRNFKLN